MEYKAIIVHTDFVRREINATRFEDGPTAEEVMALILSAQRYVGDPAWRKVSHEDGSETIMSIKDGNSQQWVLFFL